MTNLFYLQQLVSYYDEMVEEGAFVPPFTFDEFVRNEWEKREEIYIGWDDQNPDKDTLAYYAGIILGEIEYKHL